MGSQLADEPIYFQCPACGRSFRVRSEYSMRIWCGRLCAAAARAVAGGDGDARLLPPPERADHVGRPLRLV
jgi:hypothetical protein